MRPKPPRSTYAVQGSNQQDKNNHTEPIANHQSEEERRKGKDESHVERDGRRQHEPAQEPEEEQQIKREAEDHATAPEHAAPYMEAEQEHDQVPSPYLDNCLYVVLKGHRCSSTTASMPVP